MSEQPFTIADARRTLTWAASYQQELAQTHWPLKRARHQAYASAFTQALEILDAITDVPQPQEVER